MLPIVIGTVAVDEGPNIGPQWPEHFRHLHPTSRVQRELWLGGFRLLSSVVNLILAETRARRLNLAEGCSVPRYASTYVFRQLLSCSKPGTNSCIHADDR
jgi:hypothetical protein